MKTLMVSVTVFMVILAGSVSLTFAATYENATSSADTTGYDVLKTWLGTPPTTTGVLWNVGEPPIIDGSLQFTDGTGGPTYRQLRWYWFGSALLTDLTNPYYVALGQGFTSVDTILGLGPRHDMSLTGDIWLDGSTPMDIYELNVTAVGGVAWTDNTNQDFLGWG